MHPLRLSCIKAGKAGLFSPVGNPHDYPVAERLIRRVKPAKRMLGDKAYDSAELREELDERGTKSVIPNRCNRKRPFSFSKRLYKLRWRFRVGFVGSLTSVALKSALLLYFPG